MLAKDSNTSDNSSASDLSASKDDDLEMLLSTLWPTQKELGCHINYVDIPAQDFEIMFR